MRIPAFAGIQVSVPPSVPPRPRSWGSSQRSPHSVGLSLPHLDAVATPGVAYRRLRLARRRVSAIPLYDTCPLPQPLVKLTPRHALLQAENRLLPLPRALQCGNLPHAHCAPDPARQCATTKKLGDQLFRPRKQATAMKTPSKTPVSPCNLDNFSRLDPSESQRNGHLFTPGKSELDNFFTTSKMW